MLNQERPVTRPNIQLSLWPHGLLLVCSVQENVGSASTCQCTLGVLSHHSVHSRRMGVQSCSITLYYNTLGVL